MAREILAAKRVTYAIHWIRGQKVLLDFDLAELYRVPTGALNQAVRRNRNRFPSDFVFQLNAAEESLLKSQFVISKTARGGRRRRSYAFTEQGVAMLSSVLRSERAAKVNIAIMRAFVHMRDAIANNAELARKFAELEGHVGRHDKDIAAIVEAIRRLMAPPQKPTREIGFHVRETAPRYGSAKKTRGKKRLVRQKAR